MDVRMAERPHAPKKYERAHARLIWTRQKVAWTAKNLRMAELLLKNTIIFVIVRP
jgi:hypothetical protein